MPDPTASKAILRRAVANDAGPRPPRRAMLERIQRIQRVANDAGPRPPRRDLEFFKGLSQVHVSAGEYELCLPTFYYDFTSLQVAFVTPLTRIRALLPSPVMHPLRLTPWHGLTLIGAYEYRDTDIGPYNEVGIMFPITLLRPAPVLTGLLRHLAEGPMVHIWQLPVTTEVARYLGVEGAGFPKFLADIRFERDASWVHCRVAEGESHILTLSLRKIPVQGARRARYHLAPVRGDRILRLEANVLDRRLGLSRNPADVRLELGDHPVARELRRLGLGRMLECRYGPESQLILSPPLESYALS